MQQAPHSSAAMSPTKAYSSIFSTDGRTRLQTAEKRWPILLSIRIIGLISSLIVLILYILGCTGAFFPKQTGQQTPSLNVYGLVFISWSIFWNLVNILLFIFSGYALSPGRNIFFDAVAWAGLFWPAVGSVLFLEEWASDSDNLVDYVCSDAGSSYGSSYYSNSDGVDTVGYLTYGFTSSQQCYDTFNELLTVQKAITVFLFIAIACHIVTWLWASRRSTTIKREKKAQLAMERSKNDVANAGMTQTTPSMAPAVMIQPQYQPSAPAHSHPMSNQQQGWPVREGGDIEAQQVYQQHHQTQLAPHIEESSRGRVSSEQMRSVEL